MKYGVILPNVGPLARIDSLVEIAQRVEDLGYDGVFLSDHIAIPTELRSAYPYRSDGRFPLTAADRILEPVTTLSYLAAMTTRLHLGSAFWYCPTAIPAQRQDAGNPGCDLKRPVDRRRRRRLDGGGVRGVGCQLRRPRRGYRRAHRDAQIILDGNRPRGARRPLQRRRPGHGAAPGFPSLTRQSGPGVSARRRCVARRTWPTGGTASGRVRRTYRG